MHYQFTHKSIRQAVLFATVLIATSAHSNCLIPAADAPLPVQLAALPNCQNEPRYLAHVGQLLTVQGQYANAIDHLERALMLEPNLLDAQLNYAISLAGIGDLLSASQLLDGLLTQPDIPSDIRRTLIDAKQRIARQQGQPMLAVNSPSAFQVNINLRSGYDSNLLGVPNISSLELTIPGGSIVLPLATSSVPRSGMYTRADVKLEYTHRRPDGSLWELAASALQRKSPNAPDADTQQAELTAGYSQSLGSPFGLPLASPIAGYISTSFAGVNTQGGTRYASQGLAMGLQLSVVPQNCNSRVGLDWQNRDVRSNLVLSGRYSGVNTVFGCNAAWGGQWQLSAKLGQDRPKDFNRPGGIQNSATLRGVGIWPTTGLGFMGTALLDLEYNVTRDTTGYSPLLSNAAVRQTRRVTTRVEYQRPLSQSVIATAGFEWSGQRANLALFRVKSYGPYAALRFNW